MIIMIIIKMLHDLGFPHAFAFVSPNQKAPPRHIFISSFFETLPINAPSPSWHSHAIALPGLPRKVVSLGSQDLKHWSGECMLVYIDIYTHCIDVCVHKYIYICI